MKGLIYHIYLLFLVISYGTGLVSLVMSIIVYYRKNELFKYYIPFFLAYTLIMFLNLVVSYFLKTPGAAPYPLIMATAFVVILLSIVLGTLLIPAWIHHLFSVPFRKVADLFFVILTAAAVAASVTGFFSDATVLAVDRGELSLSPLIRGAFAACGFCVVYSLAIGILYFKNLQDPRYRRMIKTLMALVVLFVAVTALALALKRYEIYFREETLGYYFITPGFYLLWSATVIYYCSRYFLQVEHDGIIISPSPKFVREYDITDREVEVLKLLAHGYSNGDISDELSISLATVKTHVHNIFSKTGAKNRTELLSIIMYER
jgi:DNA-binding CsgD family transcriptional regulator